MVGLSRIGRQHVLSPLLCLVLFAQGGNLFADETLTCLGAPAALRTRTDTKTDVAADGSVLVRCTGGGCGWPGVEIRPAKGTWDWSNVGELEVVVSNGGERAERVLSGVGGEKEKIIIYAGTGIPPKSVRSIVIPIADAAFAVDGNAEPLDGMKNQIPSNGDCGGFSGVTILTVYNEQPGTQHPLEFTVLAVRAAHPARKPFVISADEFFPFVDKYGQFRHGDWPGKVWSDEEFAAACRAEDEWLAAHRESPVPDVDEYGGWKGGPQLEATGFFRVEKVRGKWWFVDPNGWLFFSLGVGSILTPNHSTRVAGREKYFEAVPRKPDGDFPDRVSFTHENLVRRFGASWREPFAKLVNARCKSWGFNTLGCWCADYITSRHRLPYTATIDVSSETVLPSWKKTPVLRPVPDVFSDRFVADLTARVEALSKRIKDDPWCLGVFVDNEMNWSGCGEAAGAAAEKYYTTVRAVLKKSLPNHLYLGSRIHQAPKEVWVAAARHCDVVSSNIYLVEPADDLERYAPDKPLLVGEFHFGAKDRGCPGGGLCAVFDQEERAARLRRYVESCLDNPRYVGCYWFQMQDEEIAGRFDGENWNIGFVSICELPYPEMVASLRDVASRIYTRRFKAKERKKR